MGCIESRYSRLKYLSGENLEYLKANTGYDKSTIKESHEIFIKECPNGNLTPDKLIDLYTPFISKGKAEQYCDHVFRTFDTDQNGFIDFEEFVLATGKAEQYCDYVFKTFDTDQNGFRDFEEFVLAMYVTSAGSAEEKLKWAFRMHDVDGNGVIDPDEMSKVVEAIYGMWCEDSTEQTKISAKERAMKIFRRMDENEDGHLTEEEFLQGCLEDDELSKLLAQGIVE